MSSFRGRGPVPPPPRATFKTISKLGYKKIKISICVSKYPVFQSLEFPVFAVRFN
jgi:hypothetical protein